MAEPGQWRDFPGPRTRELNEAYSAAVAPAISAATPVWAVQASGATIVDVEGDTYIDFAGGIGVMNLGHCHPEVVRAVQEQAARFMHTCFQVARYEPYLRLCEALNRLTPGGFPKKTALFNSGAEAVENAVKVARRYTGRTGIVAFENAFHGRTLLGMTLTGKNKPYKDGFGPYAPEVYRLPFPYTYRRPAGMSADAYTDACLDAVRRFLAVDVNPQRIAAFIIEPVQGEGGFLVADKRFMQGLRAIADEHGILLIADEIQTGFGRTGTMYAMEHFGVAADIVTTAKSVAAGMPVSAVTGRSEVMDAVPPGGMGGTYMGNPLACAAALKVLEVYEREDVLAQGRRTGEILRRRLAAMQEKNPLIGDVRGLGAMMAVELVKDRETREPAAAETARALALCHHHGLIIIKAGIYDNVIRILVPLTVPEQTLHFGLDILERALAQAARLA